MTKETLANLRTTIGPSLKQERWVTDHEANLIQNIVKANLTASYIESGTANGYSSCWAAMVLPANGKIYTYDPVDRPKLWSQPGLEEIKEKIRYFQAPFVDITKTFSTKWEHPFTIFIDGDHGRQSVLDDWNAVKNYLTNDDVIIFHDLDLSGVQKAIAEITEPNLWYNLRFRTRRKTHVLIHKDADQSIIQNMFTLFGEFDSDERK